MSLRSPLRVKRRGAPWGAAAERSCRLPFGRDKAVAGATALQGASRIFMVVRDSSWSASRNGRLLGMTGAMLTICMHLPKQSPKLF
jgi:hypothetical protein